MRKLIAEEWISLDGFAVDKQGSLDFFPTTEENRYADERQLKFLDTVDMILLGRKTYELFVDYWPTVSTEKELIADKLNEIPKVVISNSLERAPWGSWAPATIMSGDAVSAIRRLKQLPGKNIILWGSISLLQSLVKADLIDQYRMQICPSIVGGGRALFDAAEQYKSLTVVEQGVTPSGVVYVHYERGR